MASTGATFPGTGGTDSSIGAYTWADTARALTDNLETATANSGSLVSYSYYLTVTNFGFGLPAGAVILGIEAVIDRKGYANVHKDYSIKLIKGGTVSGNNKADTSVFLPTTLTTKTYGGATDLWGLTLSDTDVESSTFGLAISYSNNASYKTVYVDYISLNVYYTIIVQQAAGGALTPSGVVRKKTITLPMTGGVTPSGALVRLPQINRAGGLGLVGTIGKSTFKQLASNLMILGGLVKKTIMTILAGELTFEGEGRGFKGIYLTLTGAIAPTGQLVKQLARRIRHTLSLSGSTIKQLNRRLDGALTFVGGFSRKLTKICNVAGAIQATGRVIKSTSRSLAGTLATSSSIVKSIARLLQGEIQLGALLAKVKSALAQFNPWVYVVHRTTSIKATLKSTRIYCWMKSTKIN